MKKHFIVVTKNGAFNMSAESVAEVKAEFGADCTIYQEVTE